MIKRLLATVAATAAFATALATPAAASPEDGQGCVGTPTIPGAYVCVISLTPTSALPTVTTSSVPVPVPPVCYFLDCTDPTTVNVPVPGLTPGSGTVAVLWYQGRHYPIAAGTDQLVAIVGQVVTTAVQIANGVVTDVNEVLAGLPTSDELVTLLLGLVAPYVQQVQDTLAGLDPDAVLYSAVLTYCRQVSSVERKISSLSVGEPSTLFQSELVQYAIDTATCPYVLYELVEPLI